MSVLQSVSGSMAKSAQWMHRDDVVRMLQKRVCLKPSRIASALNISISTVNRILRHDPKDGLRVTGTRATPKTKVAQRKLFAKWALEMKTHKGRRFPACPSTRALIQRYWREKGGKVLQEKVRRMLKKEQLGNFVRPIIPYKTSLARLPFVEAQLRKPKSELKKYIFSDEHFVNVNDHGPRTQWSGVKGGPHPKDLACRRVQRPHNVANLQIWGAIGVGWRSEVVILPKRKEVEALPRPKNAARMTLVEQRQERTRQAAEGRAAWKMNGAKYINLCLTKANTDYWSKNGCTFMQDGAKAHANSQVIKFLADKKVKLLTPWPADSPDLNPIEQLWAILNRAVDALAPRNEKELVAATIRAWKEVDQKVINNLVLSFRDKCQRVKDTVPEPEEPREPRKVRADKGLARGRYGKRKAR